MTYGPQVDAEMDDRQKVKRNKDGDLTHREAALAARKQRRNRARAERRRRARVHLMAAGKVIEARRIDTAWVVDTYQRRRPYVADLLNR